MLAILDRTCDTCRAVITHAAITLAYGGRGLMTDPDALRDTIERQLERCATEHQRIGR